ncbi:MAG: UvrD-helicase domain-containing protein [Alphaproteobacteria bacterium]|nr:UvrD-helicase domain-containing protein [Alphaproteobacteria bacterium]
MSDPFALDDEPPPPVGAVAPLASASWLDGLNPEQRLAVESTEGPLLVLSGAGTGKTRVLTTRLAHLLASGLARPWQCLVVTFTNRAAREMRERIASMMGPSAEALWLGTFHALGVRILRRHAPLVGLESNFTILDTDDQLRLVKQLLDAEGVDGKKWPAQGLLAMFQRWKDRGLAPQRLGEEGGGEFAEGRAGALYAAYQERLRVLNAADFGDLLLHTLEIFTAHPDVLEQYQERFKYILVDEYQDTNVAQYLWLRLLARRHKNICCVGDDDQSIYSWRGAEVGNILRFERDFPGARVIRLESNYRSTAHILGAASGLIACNLQRLGKTLRAGLTGVGGGDKVSVRGVWDGADEARVAVEEIEQLHRDGLRLSQIAILVRTGAQTREFEERLIVTGTPYRVLGGLRFYERQEIRDALAYARVVAQPADSLAFERIVNTPKRGLGDATMQALHALSRAERVPLLEAARRIVASEELKPKARQTLTALIGDFDRWGAMLGGMPHSELIQTVLDESGYTAMWQAEKTPDARGRLDNLKEFVRALEEYDSLQSFLEHVALVMENDGKAQSDGVTIMTLHGAKGLEFDAVFLPGWEEGLFPHQRALDESGAAGLEEERRLAYVGITRARRRVFISHAGSRRIYNQWQDALPSRFLAELPAEHVERQANPGLWGGQAGLAEAGGGEGWQTPGWERMRRAPPVVEATSWKVETPRKAGAFQVGGRVFHQKFGYGRIEDVQDDKLVVAFDKAGTKKVMGSFVTSA